jgi:hypothetical protein
MSTHMFPVHTRYQTEHDKPESFLIVAAVILAALFILIALSVAVAVAFGAVMGIFTPTSPSIPTPDRLDCSLGPLISVCIVAFAGAPRLPETPSL